MKKRIGLLFCILCLGLSGCAEGSKKEQTNQFTASGGPNVDETEMGTMTLSMRVPETLNPLQNREETVDRILKLIYLPLLDFDESGKAAPSVGKSWEFSADGKSLTMQLDSNILWQNGSPLTAQDVVYSFGQLRQAPEDAVYKRVLDYVSGCQAMGTNTVVFTFYETFSGNLSALRFPVISSASADPLQPVGDGPYEMASYTQAAEMILQANGNFFGAAPQIPTIRVKITAGEETDINAFEQGMTDVLVAEAVEAGKYGDESLSGMHQFASETYDFIAFNFNRSLFQDKSLRQAVAYAVPKESLQSSVYLQYAAMTNTPIHPKSWLYEENVAPYNYDPEMAATFLKNSGWIDENKDGRLEKNTDGIQENLRVTLLVNQENTARKQIASKLREELQAIGFEVVIDQQPFAEYEAKFMAGDYDMVIGGWQFSEVTDLSPFFATGGSRNYIGYSNEEIDQLLQAAYSAVGEGQTLLAYSSLQKKLAEELPYISIAYRNEAVFTSKYVGGEIAPTGFDVYRNISAWTYEKKAGE